MSNNSTILNWNSIYLKQNPFPNTPPRDPNYTVWAGFTRLREQFNNIFHEAISTDRTQVVLNWGEYGSGKTHAATFFQLKNNVLLDREIFLKDVEIYYIQTPREQDKADILLYRSILEAIKFKRIRKSVKNMIDTIGSEKTLDILQKNVDSEVLGKSIWLLGQNRNNSGQLVLFDEETSSSDWDLLLESFFHSQASKNDLKKLGLSRGIDSAHDRFRVLGGMLNTIIGFGSADNLAEHSRVILWIDEMENLIYFTSKYYLPFTQGLRELIDQLPQYFTVFMNVTLASPEAFQDIETILGKALLDRKTHEVYFREPNNDEAFEYVKDILRFYRTEAWNENSETETYPFEEPALKKALSDFLNTRTPRDINQLCSDIVTTAFNSNYFNDHKVIDSEFVVSWANERNNTSL